MAKGAQGKKDLLAFMSVLWSIASVAQTSCLPHTTHALGDECLGGALLDCGQAITQVIWSTGDEGFGLDGLEPGSYSCITYAGGTPADTFTFVVEREQWVWAGYGSYATGFGRTIFGDPQVSQYCDTPVFNGLCCYPDAAQTYIDLIQDGITVLATQSNVFCFGGVHIFPDVPPGHAYTLRVRDLHCGQVLEPTDTIVVNNCDSLALDLGVTATVDDDHNGSIELVQAGAETSGPYPLPAGPVPGQVWLYSGLTDWNEAAPSYPPGTTNALWTGLDSGYYRVVFRPDAGCNYLIDTVYVPRETSTDVMHPEASRPVLSIMPSVVHDDVFVQGLRNERILVRVFDTAGHLVSQGPVTGGRYGLGGSPPGLYVIEAEQGGAIVRQRVLKP